MGNGLTRSIDLECLKDVLYLGLVRGGSAGVYGSDMPAVVEPGDCDSEGTLLDIEYPVEERLYGGLGVLLCDSTSFESMNCRR